MNIGRIASNAVLRYPGAKWRIADFILRHMPQHHSYLEPFFGSGAVLFRKQPSAIETVNDINGDIVNLFRVVQEQADVLADYVAGIPYARQVYEVSLHVDILPTAKAGGFLDTDGICLLKCRSYDASPKKVDAPTFKMFFAAFLSRS